MRMTDIKFSDCLAILRENSKLILVVLLASCVTSFLGAEMLMDGDYWSEAEIQVLYGAGSSTGGQNSDRSVILVRERMTPAFLQRVIADNGLYLQNQRLGSLAEALKTMEGDISASVVQDDVVRLAFRASDPKLAQRVTSQLASQCETANRVSGQENLVLSDLTGAIKKAETDLAKQEGRVKDFNLRFLGSHLEKQTATLATLNRLILQLQSNADLLNALQEQKSSQERLLTQESQRPSEPIVHPDSNLPQASQADSLAQSNPSGLSFAERQIKIDQFNREIDKRKRQQTEIRKEMAAYQSKIDSTPQVRSLQSWITRDYDKAKLHYQELLAKKNEAEMAKAAKEKIQPICKVLSPASFPDTPSDSANQFMAKLSGLLWGPLIAMGLVAWRGKKAEQRVSLEEVISQLGVPVLASIPWIPISSIQASIPDADSRRSSTQST